MPGLTTGTKPSLDRAGFPAETTFKSPIKVLKLEGRTKRGLHSHTPRAFKHGDIRQSLITLFCEEEGPANPGGEGGGHGGKIGVPSSFTFKL